MSRLMRLVEVVEGDLVRAGYGFPGPQKFGRVTRIEWVSDEMIEVATEHGVFCANWWVQPEVIRPAERKA